MNKLGGIAKALLAALIAGLGSLSAVLVDNKSLGDVTDGQWVTIVLATLVALAAVYGVPNRSA
jgi:hypothetical protein